MHNWNDVKAIVEGVAVYKFDGCPIPDTTARCLPWVQTTWGKVGPLYRGRCECGWKARPRRTVLDKAVHDVLAEHAEGVSREAGEDASS